MTAEPTREPGTIITFYSYKGGTGRSMALANAAYLLTREIADPENRVCVIDWDLEAPGLHRYFPVSDFPGNVERAGIIDYFWRLRESLDNTPGLYEELQQPKGSKLLDKTVPLSDYVVANVGSGIDLMKAGCLGNQYTERVASFDWADFYRRYRQIYKVFRELLAQRYRWCLVDSRTGLSDVSGVCTMLMPEKLVAAFTPNRQSLEGLLDLVEKAVEYRRRSDDPRPLAVFPMPSRIVTEEHDLQKKAYENYREKFEQCFTRVYGIKRCDLDAYFEEVAIPHKGFYGFGEQVAVRDDPSASDALSINRAYERFCKGLVTLDCAWDLLEEVPPQLAPAEVLERSRRGHELRPALRIFISSTAVDLTSYREHVRDAVLRLKNLPIQMETFSAMLGQPVAECTRMAAEADAVVCIVAHRYGYVPPVELGGDGERSITWLEVDAARRAGKPVFSFLVDPQAPWTAAKEQDRLVNEPEKAAEIIKSVQKLKEFKERLSSETARLLFSDPHQLEAQVTAALSHFQPQTANSMVRIWKPLICHALQPAPHFRGRTSILNELREWLVSPVTPDRVFSLVAVGGTGKTALINEALHEASFSGQAGVFVWSFYEDAHTDNFLRAAYLYFTGKDDASAGGMLERLQMVLAGDAPHVLILDGLERAQTDEGLRRRGELEDPQLKRLVRSLAGGLGNARALVTSRFPLVDLEDFKGAGHRAILLGGLDRENALAVLRGWGLQGDDPTLAKIIEPLDIQGTYHALSVAALGSYLGNFSGPMPEFSLADAKNSDPTASRLSCILDQYAKALTPAERDLLARLSLFPRGVKVELLGWIAQSGGKVAGALVGLSDQELVMQLERLKKFGLVFAYGKDRGLVYSAHPFLRDFFRNLLAASPEAVHESVRARLAPTLEVSPRELSRDPAILDRYELLIEETLLAGKVQEAFDLYRDRLGNVRHLRSVGEIARGLRILERFAPQDDFSGAVSQLLQRDQSILASSLGFFAMYVGDLSRARRAHHYALEIDRQASDAKGQSIHNENLADLELLAGNFPLAADYAQRAVLLAGQDDEPWRISAKMSFRASVVAALGEMEEAANLFKRASEIEGAILYSLNGVLEAEFKALRGLRQEAISQTENNRQVAIKYGWGEDQCRCDALLARLCTDDPVRASSHLADARAFASRSGIVELQLSCFHSACELQRSLGDSTQSITEAEAGILLADTCGFGKYSIDLRLALAESLLAAGEPTRALQNAREALDRSQFPDCRYAWGQADGLHLCGIAHLRLGERELARQRLAAALELRQRLGHPRIDETRSALEQLK